MKRLIPVLILLLIGCEEKLSAQSRAKIINDDYSESKILELIDSVFNSPNPSKQFIEKIQALIEKQHMPSLGLSEIPANEYYSCWNTSKSHPYSGDLWKKDTGVVLSFKKELFTLPVSGILTSKYGYREKRMHRGVDIDLSKGAPVHCSFNGMIRIAKRDGNYGNLVIVRHYNGLETVYAHLSKIKVRPGQLIKSGDLIGCGGSTGRSSGAHLHFEMRFKGASINPEQLICFSKKSLSDEEFVVKPTKTGLVAFPKKATIHTVKKGESLSVIATRYAISISKIRTLNNLSNKTFLKPGQLLRIA